VIDLSEQHAQNLRDPPNFVGSPTVAASIPPVQYALAGRHHIAYQVVGEGPFDLVYSPSWFSNLEIWWEQPEVEHVFRRLASFSRLILFDRRGTGLSDPVGLDEVPTFDDRVEDHLAVMDALGSERAAILASGVSGQLGLYVAATHPERTTALVLNNMTARIRRDADYPIGAPDHLVVSYLEALVESWGADDAPTVEGWGRLARHAMGPGAARASQHFNSYSDLRGVLDAVRVPTLVVHGLSAEPIRVTHGRYLAEHITDARFVELPGRGDVFPEPGDLSAPNPVLDEVQEFLTGSRERLDADLLLATVLFTDIADSTAQTAAVGDRRWGGVLDAHDECVRRALARHRGVEVKTTGDGFLAVFDGVVRAIECAAAIVRDARELGIEVRAGVHTGECERRGDDVSGMAVNIAARVQTAAKPGEVLVSQTVKDLVIGSQLAFVDRGQHALKGVPGEWRLYALDS
jgi:class 3 adenylate cyclase/pimeloyl-ACP methyl ester carboxylesterase